MSAEPYLKTAAAQLRRAAQEKRREIDDIKKRMTEKERQASDHIDNLKQDKRQKESRAASGEIDNNERVELERQAQQDLSQVSDTQQAVNKDKEDLRRKIQDVEGNIIELEQQAGDLERRQ